MKLVIVYSALYILTCMYVKQKKGTRYNGAYECSICNILRLGFRLENNERRRARLREEERERGPEEERERDREIERC